jgi:hypothetical protein
MPEEGVGHSYLWDQRTNMAMDIFDWDFQCTNPGGLRKEDAVPACRLHFERCIPRSSSESLIGARGGEQGKWRACISLTDATGVFWGVMDALLGPLSIWKNRRGFRNVFI